MWLKRLDATRESRFKNPPDCGNLRHGHQSGKSRPMSETNPAAGELHARDNRPAAGADRHSRRMDRRGHGEASRALAGRTGPARHRGAGIGGNRLSRRLAGYRQPDQGGFPLAPACRPSCRASRKTDRRHRVRGAARPAGREIFRANGGNDLLRRRRASGQRALAERPGPYSRPCPRHRRRRQGRHDAHLPDGGAPDVPYRIPPMSSACSACAMPCRAANPCWSAR